MSKENRFSTIVNECLMKSTVPEIVLSGLDGICQLYSFNRVQNFIRINEENDFELLIDCNFGKKSVLNFETTGINLHDSYYRKNGVMGNILLDELSETPFIHIKTNEEYESKYKKTLSLMGYETPVKKIVELFIIVAVSKNIGMLGVTILEKLEGDAPLKELELQHVKNINHILNEKIYNFETSKQLRDEELSHTTDKLTKLNTLSKFKDLAQNMIASGEDYVLFLLDIDKFKYINEIWSFEIGNDILLAFSQIIKNITGDTGLCCRISDDKFLMLTRYYDDPTLTELMMKIDGSIVQMQHELFTDIKITVIGGVFVINKYAPIQVTIDKANIARRSIKGSYKNNFQVYNENLENLSEREKQLEKRMNPALENKEFISFLQPKFNLFTNELCGAEALVRWQAKDRMIYPIEFIPSFEKNGFIMRLDFEIYEQIFEFISKSITKGYNLPVISLNVSRGHINNPRFIEQFIEKMDSYNIPHNLIELEITESIFMEDKTLLQNFIKEIRENNMTVSIDDFGTAYSSLNLLKDIVVDVIKMDKSFIDEVVYRDKNVDANKTIIKHIVSMIDELKFKIIFEGIESKEQVDFLKEIGCKYGQGYVFARPMPLDEFEEKFFEKTI